MARSPTPPTASSCPGASRVGSFTVNAHGLDFLGACIIPPAFAIAYAGDEFVVVLPGCDKAAAQRKAEESRATVAARRLLRGEGLDVRLTPSQGIATHP